jgi:hypothetical protein
MTLMHGILSFLTSAVTCNIQSNLIWQYKHSPTGWQMKFHSVVSSHWKRFPEIWYLTIYREYVKRIKFHLNLSRITVHYMKINIYFDPFRSILIRVKNVWDKICRENPNTHFIFNNMSFEKSAVYKEENIVQAYRPKTAKNGARESHAA